MYVGGMYILSDQWTILVPIVTGLHTSGHMEIDFPICRFSDFNWVYQRKLDCLVYIRATVSAPPRLQICSMPGIYADHHLDHQTQEHIPSGSLHRRFEQWTEARMCIHSHCIFTRIWGICTKSEYFSWKTEMLMYSFDVDLFVWWF